MGKMVNRMAHAALFCLLLVGAAMAKKDKHHPTAATPPSSGSYENAGNPEFAIKSMQQRDRAAHPARLPASHEGPFKPGKHADAAATKEARRDVAQPSVHLTASAPHFHGHHGHFGGKVTKDARPDVSAVLPQVKRFAAKHGPDAVKPFLAHKAQQLGYSMWVFSFVHRLAQSFKELETLLNASKLMRLKNPSKRHGRFYRRPKPSRFPHDEHSPSASPNASSPTESSPSEASPSPAAPAGGFGSPSPSVEPAPTEISPPSSTTAEPSFAATASAESERSPPSTDDDAAEEDDE